MRLTQDMRKEILAKAMGEPNKAYHKQFEALAKREHAVGMKCYKSVFLPAIRSKVNALPPEWVRTDGCLRFNVNGMSITLVIKERVPVPSRDSSFCQRLGAITGELAEEVMAVVQDKEKMKEANRQLHAKLSALLENCSTLKVLEATWPEGKPFYEYLIAAEKGQKAGLPAVMISDINTALGLATAA